MNKGNIFNCEEYPFGEPDTAETEEHLSGYHQPGELIEGLTKEDVRQLVAPMMFEPIRVMDRRLLVEMEKGTLAIGPLEPWRNWGDDNTINKLYLEFKVSAMKYNDFKGLAEINLKYPRLKVFINNSGRLCFGLYLPVMGVTLEHLQEVIRDYFRDLNDAIRNADTLIKEPTLSIGQGGSAH